MKKLLIRWVLLAVSVIIASLVTQALGLGFKVDVGSVAKFLTLLVGVAVLSLANATLGKIMKFLTMPLNCLSFGLFSLIINAVVLIIVAKLNLGFAVEEKGPLAEFFAALVASVLISACNMFLRSFVPDKKDD